MYTSTEAIYETCENDDYWESLIPCICQVKTGSPSLSVHFITSMIFRLSHLPQPLIYSHYLLNLSSIELKCSTNSILIKTFVMRIYVLISVIILL